MPPMKMNRVRNLISSRLSDLGISDTSYSTSFRIRSDDGKRANLVLEAATARRFRVIDEYGQVGLDKDADLRFSRNADGVEEFIKWLCDKYKFVDEMANPEKYIPTNTPFTSKGPFYDKYGGMRLSIFNSAKVVQVCSFDKDTNLISKSDVMDPGMEPWFLVKVSGDGVGCKILTDGEVWYPTKAKGDSYVAATFGNSNDVENMPELPNKYDQILVRTEIKRFVDATLEGEENAS